VLSKLTASAVPASLMESYAAPRLSTSID